MSGCSRRSGAACERSSTLRAALDSDGRRGRTCARRHALLRPAHRADGRAAGSRALGGRGRSAARSGRRRISRSRTWPPRRSAPSRSSDLQDAPELLEPVLGGLEHLHALGAFAAASTPIVAQGRPLGVLSVHRAEPRVWTQSDLMLLEAAAAECGLAVQLGRLLAENRERLGQQAALLRAAQALSGELAAQGLGRAQQRRLLTEPLAVLGQQATELNREPALRRDGFEQDEIALAPDARLRRDARSGRRSPGPATTIGVDAAARAPSGCRCSRPPSTRLEQLRRVLDVDDRDGAPLRAARFETGRFAASSPSGGASSAAQCATTRSSPVGSPSRTKQRMPPSARPTSSTVASSAARKVELRSQAAPDRREQPLALQAPRRARSRSACARARSSPPRQASASAPGRPTRTRGGRRSSPRRSPRSRARR